ncbi:hypothetical protein PICSAR11_03994 [Mycobacterium avium subsp. paratuberculosis]|nr:hypothetical protein [Mycobacterium avium]CAG6918840.1 hypothetical protein PICSAR104_03513 [Mycobacterium avium subsp. paratuberculosis]CAG6927388.1 hypothetical protein PICSAR11_03994 [Mycobacterium avium subsp. paratuberculosis]CAG7088168.1 hypothetical protein PICSAR18_03563 [Mycobacterium avium subsp. paratuberculosis]
MPVAGTCWTGAPSGGVTPLGTGEPGSATNWFTAAATFFDSVGAVGL